MARPKKTDTATLLRLVDGYFESTGDPDKLKCSYLEEYAVSQGVDVKAYDFRRNADVRRRMEELRESSLLRSESGAIAYKSLDVDALLSKCRTKTSLRDSLIELDESWRRIYERAAQTSKNNAELNATAEQAVARCEGSQAQIEELSEQVKQLKKDSRDITLENRYLKKMLKTYLYPAIANELLIRENVLEQTDTEVTELAMTQMADSKVPSPFSGAVAADRAMLSREESLLKRMLEQSLGGQDDA